MLKLRKSFITFISTCKNDSPYNSAGAIFIRENARKREIAENEIPDVLSRRLLSLRAYNKTE